MWHGVGVGVGVLYDLSFEREPKGGSAAELIYQPDV